MKHLIFLLIGISLVTSCGSDESYNADQLYKSGQYQEAVEAYNEVIRLRPSDQKSIYNRGRSYEQLGNREKALEDFKKAFKIDPKAENVLLSLGSYYYDDNQFEDAEYYFEMAVKNHSNSAVSQFQLGRAQHKLGKTEKALQSYNSAISMKRNFGEAFLYRGALKIHIGRKTSGCADLRQAQDLKVAGADAALSNYCK